MKQQLIIIFLTAIMTAIFGLLGYFAYNMIEKIDAIHDHQIKAIAYIKQLEEVKTDTDDLKERMIKMESKDK